LTTYKPQTKYADYTGYYRFALEGEEFLISFYVEDGVLCGIGVKVTKNDESIDEVMKSND
jgi:hypothetical protein